MIREATIEDIKDIVRLGKSFFEASHTEKVPYDIEAVYISVYDWVKSPIHAVFVAEFEGEIVGMTCGMLFPWYFNPRHMSGQELFWYVREDHRNGTVGVKLLKRLEQWAKEHGATTWIMISEALMGNTKEMDTLYKKLGYELYETGYIKDL